MNEMAQIGSEKWFETLALDDLGTPFFLYSSARLVARVARLRAALGTEVILSYKASSQPELLRRLPTGAIDGIELCSLGEVQSLAEVARVPFYVNTPALTPALAHAGAARGAQFIIDSPEQIDLLAQAVPETGALRPLMLRLSNRLISAFAPGTKPLREDQFGMDLALLREAIDRAQALGLPIEGLHLFAGSNMFARVAPALVETLAALLPEVEGRLGHRLRTLNLGGGLEQDWERLGHDFAAYRGLLAARLPGYRLLHEFGRAAFANCGLFGLRVLQVKQVAGRSYAICDGGMAQAFLLARTENLISKPRAPHVQSHATGHRAMGTGQGTAPATVAGPVRICGASCSRDDWIGEVAGPVAQGDLLIFDDCGAYLQSYAMNSFLRLGEAETHVV